VTGARVLVTGAGGQLGRALVASAPPGVDVIAADHAELDIGAGDAVAAYIARAAPEVVINAAAYTAVDRAESDADTALRVNGTGVRNLASALRARRGARLVQVSTDFVFDGRASSPYAPDAEPKPLGAYGASKLAGERAAREELGPRAVIVRSAWVYSAVGRNFLLTMLRLFEERGEVAVVADQVGTPTSTRSLAAALWRCATLPAVGGVLHWTDAGVASWYDFAVAIAEEATTKRLLRRDVAVRPIATADYPTAARRPAYSVLDKRSTTALLGIEPRHWRVELRAVLEEFADA
jgi:dTDP-4-dehydrorhamnose reductase